jgi:hypothetical protein
MAHLATRRVVCDVAHRTQLKVTGPGSRRARARSFHGGNGRAGRSTPSQVLCESWSSPPGDARRESQQQAEQRCSFPNCVSHVPVHFLTAKAYIGGTAGVTLNLAKLLLDRQFARCQSLTPQLSLAAPVSISALARCLGGGVWRHAIGPRRCGAAD